MRIQARLVMPAYAAGLCLITSVTPHAARSQSQSPRLSLAVVGGMEASRFGEGVEYNQALSASATYWYSVTGAVGVLTSRTQFDNDDHVQSVMPFWAIRVRGWAGVRPQRGRWTGHTVFGAGRSFFSDGSDAAWATTFGVILNYMLTDHLGLSLNFTFPTIWKGRGYKGGFQFGAGLSTWSF